MTSILVRAGLYTVCLAVLFADSGWAQQMGGAAAPDVRLLRDMVKIRKVTGLGRKYLVPTPDYRTSNPVSTGTPKEWAQITVTFETEPKWIDELSFVFHVMAARREDGRTLYSLYRTKAQYSDVQADRNHFATAFLRPVALKRFGDVVAIAVEVSSQGKALAEDSIVDASDKELSARERTWWKDPAVVESKVVTVREGYLLERSKSPFALINIDDYEVVK